MTFIRHLDCSCGKLVSRYFVNTAPAYALMLMFWCSHLLFNFAYACAYALVKNSLYNHFMCACFYEKKKTWKSLTIILMKNINLIWFQCTKTFASPNSVIREDRRFLSHGWQSEVSLLLLRAFPPMDVLECPYVLRLDAFVCVRVIYENSIINSQLYICRCAMIRCRG